MAHKRSVIPLERIKRAILFVRGEKVMLDADLALLYGVPTKTLVQAVKRNQERFPADFMFRLDEDEYQVCLKSQSVTSKGRGGRRSLPYVFTEQGIAMLSSVLRSKRAVQVNIEIMRAFVQLRHMLSTHKALARKIEALEQKYDAKFKVVFDALRALMAPPEPKKKRIGYTTEAES